MGLKDKTNFSLDYDFSYNGYDDSYSYDVPFDLFMKCVREYFSGKGVELDGTDNAIWNCLVDFDDVLYNIAEEMEEYLKELCKDFAYEEFKEFVEEYIEED